MVLWVRWLANGDGSLSFMARWGSWFSVDRGSLCELVRYGLWLADISGSLSIMARSQSGFSVYCGSLFVLVPWDVWLAFFYGSLSCLACFLLWFSNAHGSLTVLVLSLFWLARGYGSLGCMARYLSWFSYIDGYHCSIRGGGRYPRCDLQLLTSSPSASRINWAAWLIIIPQTYRLARLSRCALHEGFLGLRFWRLAAPSIFLAHAGYLGHTIGSSSILLKGGQCTFTPSWFGASLLLSWSIAFFCRYRL